MKDDETIVCHLLVRGRVQGVGYRAWADTEARRRGLGGWVRNRSTGAVEMVLAGPLDVVEEMIVACRRGPWAARVVSVDVSEAGERDLEERRRGETFSVLSTF